MTYTVRELPKAKEDKSSIFRWLHQRSPQGAAAWLDAYDATLERLSGDADAFGAAPESQDADVAVQQALFKTRRGRIYRVLFIVDEGAVYVLRVRGPGQPPVIPE